MTQTVSVKDFNAHAAELLSNLGPNNDVVVVEEGGKPIARLAAIPQGATAAQPRVPGLWKGKIWMADDFNAPLPDSFWLGQP